MKRLLIYILVLFVTGALGAYLFFSFAYSNKNSKDLSNLEHLLNDTDNYDIITLGSSRNQTHINPRVIDSITGLNCYNFGVDGISILEVRMMLIKYLQLHKSPKLIVINVDHNGFYSTGFLYNVTDYYKYLKDSTIRNSLSAYNRNYGNPFVRYLNIFMKMFGTSDEERSNSIFNFSKAKTEGTVFGEVKYKGFKCAPVVWDQYADQELSYRTRAGFDEQGFWLLNDCIKICNQKNIPIVFVHAPVYIDCKKIITNYDEVMNKIKKTALKEKIEYLEFDTMKICNSKIYFKNYNHLNLTGANLYSLALAKKINELINIKSDTMIK